MTAAPTFNQIKAQVAAVHRKYPHARSIGIRSEGRWSEPAELEAEGQRYLIRQCDSPLAMRIALREGDGDAIRVLITNLHDADLSNDILLRLRPSKLVPLDSWQIVKSLFQARTIDPRLTQYPWMAETLMGVMPPAGFAPVPNGFLDAETVWPILLERTIGLDASSPDLISLLKWSTKQDNIRRFQQASPEFRDAACRWLATQAGRTVSAVLNCVAKQDKPDALPIGLALAVFLHPEHASLLQRAAGKMEERFLASQTLDADVMAHWSAAANEIVRLQLPESRRREQLLDRADEILKEVGADSHAWLSDGSPIGFEQRLVRFADRLSEAIESFICHPEGGSATEGSPTDSPSDRDPSPRVTRLRMTLIEDLLRYRQSILNHERASRERRRLERLDMATRLVQWFREKVSGTNCAQHSEGRSGNCSLTSFPRPRSLGEAAHQYSREGSFVDWARLSLRSGDSVGKLSQAYAKLFDFCTTRQEQDSRKFAELLANYTRTNSSDDDLIHVEDFLDRVVAPLAARGPVLLIVMDGMSMAVARELISDITSRDWVSLVPDGQSSIVGLAAIPSVTEVSRASLLCGTLCQGDQNKEQRQFEQHAALNKQSRGGYPPVLFHKGHLQESEDTGLSADVRKEISSSHRKVVGVVVNAIDDHLAKGEQIDTRWTRDEIRGLSALLHEARNAGRTVIFVSDHGHVLDCGTQAKMFDGMERWRNDDGQPTDIELQISGHRVVVPDSQKLIAPWSERIRFCNQKKNGYHGGVSPQEMVIPISVLSAGEAFPPGWSEAPVDMPAWWEIQDKRPTPTHPEPRLKPPEPIEPPEPPPGMLFPVEPLPADGKPAAVEEIELGPSAFPIADWIKTLLASPVFDSQKQLAGRAAAMTPPRIFAQLLQAVDRCGGKITSPALARAMSTSPMRLRGYFVTAQRILNIDGYGVLTKDDASDTVQLDRDLLLKQFDLTE